MARVLGQPQGTVSRGEGVRNTYDGGTPEPQAYKHCIYYLSINSNASKIVIIRSMVVNRPFIKVILRKPNSQEIGKS